MMLSKFIALIACKKAQLFQFNLTHTHNGHALIKVCVGAVQLLGYAEVVKVKKRCYFVSADFAHVIGALAAYANAVFFVKTADGHCVVIVV
jgi:hypothetical protein